MPPWSTLYTISNHLCVTRTTSPRMPGRDDCCPYAWWKLLTTSPLVSRPLVEITSAVSLLVSSSRKETRWWSLKRDNRDEVGWCEWLIINREKWGGLYSNIVIFRYFTGTNKILVDKLLCSKLKGVWKFHSIRIMDGYKGRKPKCDGTVFLREQCVWFQQYCVQQLNRYTVRGTGRPWTAD